MTVVVEETAAHPWFGTHRLQPAAPVDTLRSLHAYEMRDYGWPTGRVAPMAPITLPRASRAELFRATAALLDLVRRTALETAPDTAGRLDAYGMPASEHQLFVDDPFVEERYADCVARPDVVIGPDGPQFLEFNVSGALGGPVEVHGWMRMWRQVYADDLGRLPFTPEDPFAVRAAMFRDLSDELGVAPRVAVVGSALDQGVAETRYFDVEADVFNQLGLPCRFFDPADLHQAWDCAPHLRYPLGLRNFTIPDWVDLGIDTTPVQAALDNGCLLVGTQTSTFLGSKVTLGLLSEGRPWMSAAERALVERYLPWTRVLGDRRSTWRGREVDLLRFAVDNRELLVLKAGLGMSGKEVVIGAEAEQGEWERAVAEAATLGTSVVQEFVAAQSCRLSVVAADADEPHVAEIAPVLGPLLFGGRPAGIFARFYTDGSAGIVSIGAGNASDGCVVAL